MFHSHRLKAVVYLNHLSSTPKSHHLLHSLNPFSTTSDSFTLSYFTNNCGLSPQDALKASKRLRLTFTTPEKPNSVIAFFKTHGFSIPQIQSIILKNPQLILSNPTKTILPKFQFLASKGASPSDIVAAVTRSSRFLRVSLEKHIIPAFQLVALATAAKAKLLLRELKTVKADLAFAKARCAQLEEENKLLREREGSDKGLIRDDDDLILVISSIGLIFFIALRYHLKKIRDQKIIPRLRLSRAGHPPKLERFSHYVSRQMGFKDRRIGPDICRLASEYISKYEGFEDDIYAYFENEPDADSLYVKLVEEFERCILSYFGFHWNHCDILISQVLSSDISEPKKKLKNIVMAATRDQRFERVAKSLKVASVFNTLVEEMKAMGIAEVKYSAASLAAQSLLLR
ncbi:unnamed protein product [Vicia faba]|uniref:Uncharacterized protein n=1 Tax=Vicia faba TaxID=3906 RepID=A0AAV1B0N3_VICFA|nr:unnamed protein product [Vicia faba]